MPAKVKTKQEANVHCVHLKEGPHHSYVLFDKIHRLEVRGTKKAAIDEWQKMHGMITLLTTYSGTHRRSELAMTIADYRHEDDEGKEGEP